MNNSKLYSILLLAGLCVAGTYTSQATDAQMVSKPYPLKTCLVSGEKLKGHGDHSYVLSYTGQELKLCCMCCLKEFKKEPAAYLKKLALASPKRPVSPDKENFFPIADPYLDAILH